MSDRPHPRHRGALDAAQDACENAPFSSVGGLEARSAPRAPAYILPEERDEYLAGYTGQCALMYGENWRTAEFRWTPALQLGGEAPGRRELTDAERLTNAETMRHILTVRSLLGECALEMLGRGDAHDKSKLREPEVNTFTKWTPVLAGLTYGSEEYRDALDQMKPALDNHYRCNRHHPEHHADGIAGMNLFDLLEMLIDWKAATLRHKDGDLDRSLRINTERYDMPEPIRRLIANTIPAVQRMAKRANVAASYPHVEGGA